jgi:hypothetical protein
MRTIWSILIEYPLPSGIKVRKNYVTSNTMQIVSIERHLNRVKGKIIHRVVMPIMDFDEIMEDIDNNIEAQEMLV